MSGNTQVPDRECDQYLKRSVVDLFSLKDRVTVITGGARGIGLAFAVACAEVGSHIAILDVSSTPHDDFSRLQNDYGVKVKLYQTDVTSYDVLEETFDSIVKDFGRVDGLVTAAGICPDQPFTKRDPAAVRKCLDINVLGTYFSAQLFTKQVEKQDQGKQSPRGGSIVMIGSVCAYMASKAQFLSDYCASKGAVVTLAKGLGVELAPMGIRVNSISPGYTATDMTLSIADSRPELFQIFQTEPPMKRMGDRADLKGALVYLLSDASAYTTSTDILITGGLHAGRV
jgi:NAD(P)-dependent dehydrogenase (short-subunit alcohol dehydrogenase family)